MIDCYKLVQNLFVDRCSDPIDAPQASIVTTRKASHLNHFQIAARCRDTDKAHDPASWLPITGLFSSCQSINRVTGSLAKTRPRHDARSAAVDGLILNSALYKIAFVVLLLYDNEFRHILHFTFARISQQNAYPHQLVGFPN